MGLDRAPIEFRKLVFLVPPNGYEIDIQHLKNSIFPQMMTMIAMTMTRMEARGQQQRWRRRSMAGASQLDCDVGASSVSPQLVHRGGGSHTMGVTHLALMGDRQTHLSQRFMGIWKPDL